MPAETVPDAPPSPDAPAEASASGGFAAVIAVIMDVLHTIFGTGQGRRTRLSPGQRIARNVTRSVTNQVAGKVVGNELRRLQALLFVGRIGRDGLNTKQVEQSLEACIEISVNSCKYGGQSLGGCHVQRLVVWVGDEVL